jgi:hypothetical protein
MAGARSPEFDAIRHRPATVLGHPQACIRVVTWRQTERELAVEVPGDGMVIWHVIRFPEMEVTVDGRAIDISTDATTGLVSHSVPAGAHQLRWRWRPDSLIRTARALSVFSVFAGIGLLVVGSRIEITGHDR